MTTILLCHGFIQNARAFDVPGLSAVSMLEAAGYRVRALNLRGRTGRAPASGFSVYVGDAARIVEEAAHGGEPVVWIGHSMGGLIGASLPERARTKLAGLVTIGAPVVPGPTRLHQPGLEAALVAWSRAMHAAGRSFPGGLYGRAFSRARTVAESRAPLPIRLWKAGAMEPAALDVMLHETFSHDSFAVFADLLGLISSGGVRAGHVAVGERISSLAAPLLVIAGQHDELAPAPSARLLYERAK
jgi:pimeloyl-ACP methyl ester carboxylesterase